MVFCEFIIDDFVCVSTDLTQQINHFVRDFPPVYLYILRILDEVLEKVGVLLTFRLDIDLEEV